MAPKTRRISVTVPARDAAIIEAWAKHSRMPGTSTVAGMAIEDFIEHNLTDGERTALDRAGDNPAAVKRAIAGALARYAAPDPEDEEDDEEEEEEEEGEFDPHEEQYDDGPDEEDDDEDEVEEDEDEDEVEEDEDDEEDEEDDDEDDDEEEEEEDEDEEDEEEEEDEDEEDEDCHTCNNGAILIFYKCDVCGRVPPS